MRGFLGMASSAPVALKQQRFGFFSIDQKACKSFFVNGGQRLYFLDWSFERPRRPLSTYLNVLTPRNKIKGVLNTEEDF
jgi:hypothetical protein